MSASRSPYPARPFCRTPNEDFVESDDRSGGPERNGRTNSDGAPPRHEDRARDRIASTRPGLRFDLAHEAGRQKLGRQLLRRDGFQGLRRDEAAILAL